jgi:hypothetical protein
MARLLARSRWPMSERAKVESRCARVETLLTDYYRGHPLVLVRLSRIERDALRDVLSVSWRLTLAKARKGGRSRRHGESTTMP